MGFSGSGQPIHLTAAKPDGKAGGNGEQAVLHAVNVGVASTSASLAIYSGPYGAGTGTPSTTGTLIATVDVSSTTARGLIYDIRCPGGVYAVLTPAATGADVTLTVF